MAANQKLTISLEDCSSVKETVTCTNPLNIFLHQRSDKIELRNQTLQRNQCQSKEQPAMRGHLSSSIIIFYSQVAI